MRQIINTGLLVFIMFTVGCGSFITSDKWNHFAFSASISSVATVSTARPVEALVFTIGLGFIKEVYDGLWGSGFQIWDLAADMAGAGAGGYASAKIYMEEFP